MKKTLTLLCGFVVIAAMALASPHSDPSKTKYDAYASVSTPISHELQVAFDYAIPAKEFSTPTDMPVNIVSVIATPIELGSVERQYLFWWEPTMYVENTTEKLQAGYRPIIEVPPSVITAPNKAKESDATDAIQLPDVRELR